jgi:ABC-type multidrug transport system ATPase subunit
MIQVKELSKFFYSKGKKFQVLDNINFEIREGEFVKIIGPNGSGKTTFLKLIKSVIRPDQGEINFTNDISNNDIQMVSQNTRSFFMNLSIRDNLIFFSSMSQVVSAKDDKINFFLKNFNLLEKIDHKVADLSSGQLKKLSIVRALISDPKILLMDEATNTLEYEFKEFFIDYIFGEFCANSKKTIIWTTHYPDELPTRLTSNYIIENNKIVRS